MVEVEENERRVQPKPPDGGWGWLVVWASFMVHVVADGVAYTFGTFLVVITDDFSEKRGVTSWILSLMAGVTYGSGPISGAFVNKFGCRLTSIAGSILAAFGFGISYFAGSAQFLYVSIGLIAGLGLGMIYLPAIVAVSIYFDKRLAFATGLAVCGSGIGTAAMAPLAGYLIKVYHWRIALVITGGIVLSCIIFSLFFKPVPVQVPETGNFDGVLEAPSNSNPGENSPQMVTTSASASLSSPVTEIETVSFNGDLLEPLEPVQTENHGAIHNKGSIVVNCGLLTRLIKWLNTMTNFSLLLNPIFLLYAISNFLTYVGYNVPYTYLVDLAIGKDLNNPIHPRQDAEYLLSIVGVSNTLSRVILGYLSDKPWMNRLYLYNVALTICGVAVGWAPQTQLSLNGLRFCAFVFGATVGVSVNLSSVICVDLLGLENLTDAFGIILMFQGVSTVIGPPIVGALFDHFQSHKVGFGITGSLISISGLMLFTVPLLQLRQKPKKTPETERDFPNSISSISSTVNVNCD